MGGGRIFLHPRSCTKKLVERSSNSGSEDHHLPNQRKGHPKWPPSALQVVEAQLGLLSASCSRDGLQQQEQEQQEQQRMGDDQSPSPRRMRWGADGDHANDNRSPVHVDLEPQQPALPYGWEQFLDLNTGEVYYIDWSTCKRTCRDPREVARVADDKIRALRQVHRLQHQQPQELSCQSSSGATRAVGALSSSSSSSGSAVFPPQRSSDDEDEDGASSSRRQGWDADENVMVAFGCHRCLTYFMLPRLDPICPGCGARLQAEN